LPGFLYEIGQPVKNFPPKAVQRCIARHVAESRAKHRTKR
jgi:hypothetical protein